MQHNKMSDSAPPCPRGVHRHCRHTQARRAAARGPEDQVQKVAKRCKAPHESQEGDELPECINTTLERISMRRSRCRRRWSARCWRSSCREAAHGRTISEILLSAAVEIRHIRQRPLTGQKNRPPHFWATREERAFCFWLPAAALAAAAPLQRRGASTSAGWCEKSEPEARMATMRKSQHQQLPPQHLRLEGVAVVGVAKHLWGLPLQLEASVALYRVGKT